MYQGKNTWNFNNILSAVKLSLLLIYQQEAKNNLKNSVVQALSPQSECTVILFDHSNQRIKSNLSFPFDFDAHSH